MLPFNGNLAWQQQQQQSRHLTPTLPLYRDSVPLPRNTSAVRLVEPHRVRYPGGTHWNQHQQRFAGGATGGTGGSHSSSRIATDVRLVPIDGNQVLTENKRARHDGCGLVI